MALNLKNEAKSCLQLLDEFKQSAASSRAEKLIFSEVGDRDVYNITAPFSDGGDMIIAGRVEGRETEHAETMFFVERDGIWIPRTGAPVFQLQDPFVAFIGDELVFGGVQVEFEPENNGRVKTWHTVFYRGSDIDHLTYLAQGPDHMKDIRLVELTAGRIGVFTRPLGVLGARGLIGFAIIETLEQLTAERIEAAELFQDQFLPEEWGGVNEAHILRNGLIGVLGHAAYMEDGDIRHYHAMTFAFDPKTGARSPLKLIAVRGQFPEGPAKRPDLTDVLFSGGLHRLGGGKAILYAGISDAEAHRIEIEDPFDEYEASGGAGDGEV